MAIDPGDIMLSREQRERLAELADSQGRTASELLDDLLALPSRPPVAANGAASTHEYLDVEYHEYARQHANASVTRDDVRQALAGISGSMSDAVIAERNER
jgi:hypothetical protein